MVILKELIIEIREVNKKNGWNLFFEKEWKNPYKIPAILSLIHSEVSEALESFRKDDKENFKEELADIVIRVFDCVGGFDNYNFTEEIIKKINKNRNRSFRHGNKKL